MGSKGGQCAASGAGMQRMFNKMIGQSHAAFRLGPQTKHQLLLLQVDRRCIVAATLKASGAPHSGPGARLKLKALARLQQRPSRPPVV